MRVRLSLCVPICTAGGIGRHASLRNWCPQGHGSSSLPPCTICAGAGTGIRVGFKNRCRKACGFDPRSAHQYTLLAQSVEQQTFNLWVGGPIPSGRTTSEEDCCIPLPRFAQEPRKLHIRSLLLPSPHRTTLRWGPYTDVAQLADASDLRSEKLWVRPPPSVPVFFACSSVVIAPGCGPEGRRFESAHAPQTGP